MRICEILVRMGLLTQEIEDALKEQAEDQEILGGLVARGTVTKQTCTRR